MIKMIGAICIVSACTAMGCSIALSYKRNTQILQQILHALEFMLSELPEKMPALPILCRETAANTSGIIRKIFLSLSDTLDSHQFSNTYQCMQNAIDSHGALPEIAKSLLLRLARSLGHFDLPGQVAGMASVKESVERELHALVSNMDTRTRSYKTLGFCAGAALAILFV